ncbi:PREDICTED: alpha-1,3-mannosyl-glycoprotein 4-beta-N-acetylglucosaminyltransferase-like protein MGAT4D [Dipodomys ordii]|uniref:Alpha-1,3-mannosyl-glycoprotein 4-beta-N-acetylglucosaminyltransferase-like protein MGAT4D n=1 Tax=Dipodomys ordii TaxID=10020 RepID=A0A1S3GAA5_DIPOR|nr:PREDICTED: alpha-1,3-mannosyl-glycoprotein 4-beta-N-acetylglucosaminyltransferase-like protein MGAT4D [Dipodomys ordii]
MLPSVASSAAVPPAKREDPLVSGSPRSSEEPRCLLPEPFLTGARGTRRNHARIPEENRGPRVEPKPRRARSPARGGIRFPVSGACPGPVQGQSGDRVRGVSRASGDGGEGGNPCPGPVRGMSEAYPGCVRGVSWCVLGPPAFRWAVVSHPLNAEVNKHDSRKPPCTGNQLINCRNHVLEIKESLIRLKNTSENNRKDLMKALIQVKHGITPAKEEGDRLSENVTTAADRFEDMKFFLPYLRKFGRLYPNVVIGKGKKGVSFALGIPTVSRGNHSYLTYTLTSLVSRMTTVEAEDAVVIVSIADNNEDYLNSVVKMIKKKFSWYVQMGSIEVITIPTFFYPNLVLSNETVTGSESLYTKQVLDFCILMLYAQPKAMYYLQLEDDIIAKRMFFKEMANYVHNIAPNNWFFIEFTVIGFIGKLFRSEDLPGFVRFFLMFYQDKPIDLLLEDMFYVKVCETKEPYEDCKQRQHKVRIRYKPSLFQHVGIQSSFPGRRQLLKYLMPGSVPHQKVSVVDVGCSRRSDHCSTLSARSLPWWLLWYFVVLL